MNGNDSDWLNDTMPENQSDTNQQNDTTKNSENTESADNSNSENIEEVEDKVDTNHEMSEKPQQKTITNIVQDINVEKSDDEKYLEEFMGKNYEKISTKLINIPAFLFTYLYLFYRKLYLLGIITLAIQTALIIYVNPYVSLIINVILLFSTNIIYTGHAKRKIERIKNTTGSKLSQNIINVCADKGGTSGKSVFLGIVLSIAIFIFISFQFRETEPFMQIADFIDNKIEDIKFEIDNLINRD